MAFIPLPPPRSKVIDFATLVNSLDARIKDPPVVYEYSNGRKFKEFPSDADQHVYVSEDGGTLYFPDNTVGDTFFAKE